MADTPDHAAGGGDAAANEAAAARTNLPAVVAPKLSAAADQAENGADEAEQTKLQRHRRAPSGSLRWRRA